MPWLAPSPTTPRCRSPGSRPGSCARCRSAPGSRTPTSTPSPVTPTRAPTPSRAGGPCSRSASRCSAGNEGGPMLVGAFACAHTPQLLIRPSTEDRDLVLRVHAAFARVKARLEALRPDVIAVVGGDHVEAFFLDGVPALAVYAGRECAGTFGPYQYRFPI